MAYIPTNWVTGDTITAEKLNKAEGGIANACPFIVRVASYDPETSDAILDASFKDIYDAVSADRLVMIVDEQSAKNVSISFLAGMSYSTGIAYPYSVFFFTMAGYTYSYRATNETDSLKQFTEPA